MRQWHAKTMNAKDLANFDSLYQSVCLGNTISGRGKRSLFQQKNHGFGPHYYYYPKGQS
jgi:hypothetical protein